MRPFHKIQSLNPFPSQSLSKFLSFLFCAAPARRDQALALEIDANIAKLKAAADDVQQTFVSIGERFKDQALLAGRLLKQGERITDLDRQSDKDSHPLDRAISLVRGTLQFAETCSERNVQLIDSLETYHQQFQAIQRGEDQLTRTLVPLQIIERLFRIEAAVLPQGMQSAFESLTKQISEMHAEMRKTLDTEFSALNKVGNKIHETCLRLKEREQRLKIEAETAKKDIELTLGVIERRIAENRETNQKLADATRSISKESNAVIVGLQYQDTMRQRTEHVVAALNGTVSILSARNSSRTETDKAVSLLQLEAQQIHAIENDLASESQNIEYGLSRILEVLAHVDRECLSSGQVSQAIESSAYVYNSLIAAVRKSSELAQMALQGAVETFDTINAFDGTASNVTDTLRELTLGIKIIALNAQVQAAQIGDGTGLEVLSGRTCDLSDETEAFTTNIGSELENLVSRLNSVIDQCLNIKGEAESQIRKLDTDGLKLLDELPRQREENAEGLRELDALLTKCRRNAESFRKEFKLQSLPLSELDETKRFLEKASRSRPRLNKQRFHSLNTDKQELKSRYTMESERAIHDSFFLGGNTRKAGVPERSNSREESLHSEHYADNVELF